jgi:hypothetical protein
VRRSCDICGTRYEAKRGTSRYCSGACRKRAQRENKSRPASVTSLSSGTSPGTPKAGELVTRVEKQLQDAGRLETYLGQAALDLARRIEGNPGAPLSQAAAAHRELRAAVTEAVKGAKAAKSALEQHRDEVAERRARRGRAG